MLNGILFFRRIFLNFLGTDNAKTVLFINIKKDAAAPYCLLKGILNDSLKARMTLVFFNMETPEYFNQIKIEKKLSEDYLSAADCEDIDTYVFRDIAKNWQDQMENKSPLEYEGINLRDLVEYEFKLFLISRIRNLAIVKKALEHLKPSRLIVIEDTGELADVVRLMGKKMDMPVLVFSYRFASNFFIRFYRRIKAGIAEFLSLAIDARMRRKLFRDKEIDKRILIDAKLSNLLSRFDKNKRFIQSPIEKGFLARFRLLINRQAYIPFYFASVRRPSGSFQAAWEELRDNIKFRERFKYNDVFYWELIEEKLAYFFTGCFPRIIKNIEFLKKLDNARKIKLIVLRTDTREVEKTIAVTARKLRIPTFLVQHGILAETNGREPIHCDRVAVWGGISIKWYETIESDINKFVVTGNPRFDALFNSKPEPAAQAIRRKLKLSSERIILYAAHPAWRFSSYYADDRGQVLIRRILEAVNKIEDTHLVIKLHPYDHDVFIYRKLIANLKARNVSLLKKENIFDLISASDLLIVEDSTVGLEGIILNKPIISVNLTKRADMIPYAASGAALGVYKEEDIYPAIKEILVNARTRERLYGMYKDFIHNYAYKLDGLASRRVMDLIEKMAGEPN